MTEQAIFTGTGAPWYVVLLVVAYPGLLAVVLTIATVVLVRRVNREDGRPPLKPRAVIAWTLASGAVYGPMCQWGFQKLTYALTGVPVQWELVAVAPAITGIASMVAYELLRWWARSRYPGLYALISVKHSSKRGHEGDTPDGDLTELDRK